MFNRKYKEEIRKFKSKCDSLNELNDIFVDECQDLRASNKRLRDENAGVLIESAKLKEENEKLRAYNTKLQQALNAKYYDDAKHLEYIMLNIAEKSNEIEQLKIENEKLKAQRISCECCNELYHEHESLKDKYKELKKYNHMLAEDRTRSNQELCSTSQYSKNLEVDLKAQAKIISELYSQINILKAQLRETEAKKASDSNVDSTLGESCNCDPDVFVNRKIGGKYFCSNCGNLAARERE
jgi:chromosome segregation ATPase